MIDGWWWLVLLLLDMDLLLLLILQYYKLFPKESTLANISLKVIFYLYQSIHPSFQPSNDLSASLQGYFPSNPSDITSSSLLFAAKFREDVGTYTKLIEERDVEGIRSKLVNKVVEEKLLKRVLKKAATYG